MERKISIVSELGTERNNNIQAWAKANEVDPRDIVLASNAIVYPELDLIAFTVFSRDENGQKLTFYRGDAERQGMHETRLVPMLSTPEYHNL